MLRFIIATLAVAAFISAKTQVAVGAEDVSVSATFSQGFVATDAPSRIFLKVGVKAAAAPATARVRAPLNVAVVIDRSGSMQGAKIEAARDAAIMALQRLRPRDIVSVISYDNKVEVEVPATRASNPAALAEKVRRLTPRGSTAIYAGLQAGAMEARKFKAPETVTRIVLLSDGLANVGPSQPGDFRELGRKLAGEGMTVSTIGLGLGYNEDLMSQLAMASDGSHAFVQEPADLAQFFAREFDDALGVAAQDLIITIELKAGAKPIRSLGREAEISGQRLTYRVGQISASTEQVMLSEIEVPAGIDTTATEIASVTLSYRAAGETGTQMRQARAMLQASTESAKVEASYDSQVMRDATLLSARAAKDEAIKLRDAGKQSEAERKFKDTARYLNDNAQRFGFAQDARVRTEAEASAAAAAPAPAAAWNQQRKVLRGLEANTPGASVKY